MVYARVHTVSPPNTGVRSETRGVTTVTSTLVDPGVTQMLVAGALGFNEMAPRGQIAPDSGLASGDIALTQVSLRGQTAPDSVLVAPIGAVPAFVHDVTHAVSYVEAPVGTVPAFGFPSPLVLDLSTGPGYQVTAPRVTIPGSPVVFGKDLASYSHVVDPVHRRASEVVLLHL